MKSISQHALVNKNKLHVSVAEAANLCTELVNFVFQV